MTIIDDQSAFIAQDMEEFLPRSIQGQAQQRHVLEEFAEILREAQDHFDPILANLLITSSLDFLTANILDTRSEFPSMSRTPGILPPHPI